MPPTVAHHFRCPACNYDLYSAPLDGRCPECGKPVPRRKGLDKPKNPRRVNSHYRSRLRRARRHFRRALPIAVVPLAVAVGSFCLPVPTRLRVLLWIFAFVGSLSLLECWIEINYVKDRMVPEDEDGAAGGESANAKAPRTSRQEENSRA